MKTRLKSAGRGGPVWRRLAVVLSCALLSACPSDDDSMHGRGTIDDPLWASDHHLYVNTEGNETLYFAMYGNPARRWVGWFSVQADPAHPLALSVADTPFGADPTPQCSLQSTANLGGLTQCPFTTDGQGVIYARVQSLSAERVSLHTYEGFPAGIGWENGPLSIQAPAELPATLIVIEGGPSYYRVEGLAPDARYTLTFAGGAERVQVVVWMGDHYAGPFACSLPGTGTLSCDVQTTGSGGFVLEIGLFTGRQQLISLDVSPAP